MPLVVKDRVLENTSTTGTGTLTLTGAVSGFQPFSVIGNGNTTYYTIVGGAQWEVGIGTYTAAGTTLSRDVILESSSGGIPVNFGVGVKNVFCTYPAERSVDTNTAQTVSNKTIENSPIGATTPSTGAFTSVTTPSVTATTNNLTLSAISTGVVKLQTAAGEVFRATQGAATGSNYWRTEGAAVTPFLITSGNNGIIATGGTGVLQFVTNTAQEQFRISHTASAVNYVQVTGAATGNKPTISAQGSDTNINLDINSKGNGNVTFNSGTSPIFRMAGSASTANYLQVIGSPTNQEPLLSAQGSDTNINFTLQSKGTGSIDLASGSTGVNVSNGTTVTAITRTGAGTNYTSSPSVAISAPNIAGGVQATATVTIGLVGINSIGSGGTGYTVNDVLTVTGGTFTVACQVTVTAVSAGVITAVSITTGGSYTVAPTNPASVTGGTGTGATFNLSFGISTAFTITNAGSGYTSQPTVTFSGGGGSGASAYATVGSGTVIRSLGSTGNQSIDFHTPASATNGVPAFRIRDISVGTSNTGFLMVQNNNGYTQLIAQGGTTNQANLNLASNGTGFVNINTNSTAEITQLRVSHTASAVNYVQVTGAVTTGIPLILAQGSDTNVSVALASKAGGYVSFRTNTSVEQMRVYNTASAVNRIEMTGSATGSAPLIAVAGNDTNIDLSLASKGTGGIVGSINSGTFSFTRDTGNNAIKLTATNTANLYLQSTGGGAVLVNTSDTVTTQLRVTHTASAVNYVQVTGAATGSAPSIQPAGSDANIAFNITPKGSGAINLNGFTRVGFNSTNFINISGSATTVAPSIASAGGDTNIDLNITTKGTGVVNLNTGNGTAFRASQAFLTGTAVNYIDASGRQTGLGPILSVNGSDTNVRFNITSKGNEAVGLYTNLANQLQFNVTHTASAVNYIQVTGSATGSAPRMSVQGSDSTAGLGISAKGGAQIFFQNNGSSNTSLVLNGGTATVNYVQINASNTTVAPSLQALGNDTNIDLTLTPKGTGKVVITNGLQGGTF